MCEGTVDLREWPMNGGAANILPMHRRSTGVRGRARADQAACGAASSYECHDYDGDTRRWRRFSSW